MSKQSIKQQARRTALDAQTRRRARHAEREKRLERLTVQVLVAIRERDQQIALMERRAGEALAEMASEGIPVRDLVEWCGDELTAREVTRLRRLASGKRADRGPAEIGARSEEALSGGGPVT